jgi:hypothetical protein
MKPTLLGPLDRVDFYPLIKEYRLVLANKPNKVGFILLPNDGSRAIFQKLFFLWFILRNCHYLANITSDGKMIGEYRVGKNLEGCSCGLRNYPIHTWTD